VRIAVRQPGGSAGLALAPLVLGFLLVSGAFSVIVPLLEAPDEPSHAAMVRFLAAHASLPVQHPPDYFPVGQEGSQPPLYYALGALLFRLSPAPALAPTFADSNPFVSFSRTPGPSDNHNLYAHTVREAFPYRGDVLGLHLVRLVGVALGAATVALTFLTAREVLPGRPAVALLSAAVVAFNPQFAFICGVINNDSAAAAAATAVLWLLVRWLCRRETPRGGIALGATLGLAFLAKTSTLPLAALAAVGFLLGAARAGRPGDGVRACVGAAVTASIVAGWWYARNQVLYGDPLGWRAMLAASATMIRPSPLDPPAALAVLWRARDTYWGAFGWSSILLPPAVDRAVDAAAVLAALGLTAALGRLAAGRCARCEPGRVLALALLALWPVVVLAGLVQWVALNAAADQGRLLFPAVAPIGILLAVGWDELIRLVRQRRPQVGPFSPTGTVLTAALLTAGGIAANGLVLARIIAPSFTPTFAPASTGMGMPIARFGGAIELLAAHLEPTRARSGEPLTVELTWRAAAPVRQNWAVSVTLVGEDGRPLARARSWPQAGRAPTAAWPPGAVLTDRYVLYPRWSHAEGQVATVWLNLYDSTVLGGRTVPTVDADGRPISGVALGQVKLLPTETAAFFPPLPLRARFGAAIALDGVGIARGVDHLDVTLYWRALAAPTASYTVFVHLAGPGDRVVAQHDGPPRDGRYPTIFWDPGEVVRDQHRIALAGVPPGRYHLLVGLYQAATGARLPATGPVPIRDDAVEVGAVDLP
jgi:4-amino-4-deoxy-L-arabinose transferase-like glycosyltransferase